MAFPFLPFPPLPGGGTPPTPPGGSTPPDVYTGPPRLNTAPTTATDTNAAANSVAEGAAVNTLVGITAHSTDAEQAVTYALASDSSGGGFKIDPATGVVTVADPTKINFETAPGHAYTITVNSSDGISVTAQSFTINVSDIAPSTPVDSNAAANTVAEGAAANTLVGITASSTDINGPAVTYSLSNNANGAFKIDAITGVVSVADPSKIDFETSPGHVLNITAVASDGTLSSSQNFAINVSDVALTAPVDGNGAANSVAEGAANGSTVGVTAVAVDPNGPATTYSLTADSSLGGFTINAATGVVTIADGTKIDFESAPGHAYSVTVQATNGVQTTSQAFTIAVADVAPSTPVDSNAGANTVAEGAANGSTVGVTASSTDVNGPGVTYSLVGDTSGGGFTINAATGVVTVADSNKIDFETAAGHAYTVTAQASDGTLSSSQTFTIAVSDVAPSTPADGNAGANAVVEGAANGSTVGITASSSDVNGPGVTYSLVGDTSGGGFTINATTGIVTVADATRIDYESAPGHAYTVTAQASDGTLSSSQTFTIGVLDVAPSTPVDGNSNANTVAEGAANGSTVGVTASSLDVNGPGVSYSIIGDTSGGGFIINSATGVVTVADSSKLDFETSGGSYTVVVQASDGTLASSQAFVIAVTDVAPSSPVDSNAGANTIAEGAANGSTVGITASSTDVNGPAVTYSLTADSSLGGFTINAATGVVTVADSTKINFETAAGHAYTVTAQASDGTLSSSQVFTIAVSDVAPSAPVDSDAGANTVAEGAANGSTVGITASSSDVNGPGVTYSLAGDTSGGGFTINATTGIVTVADATKIDYESAAGHAYNVTVQASDGTLTSSQVFAIAVSDAAPSTPVDSNNATNTIAEGAANGSTVGITAASTDVNGPAVTYSLIGDTSGGGFTINAATGVITVADATKINYETATHSYTVIAQASDVTLSTSQAFTIDVTDVAPSTPTDSDGAVNQVAVSAPNGSNVGLTASSTDINGPAVTYTLVGDTSGGGFTVNATTGVVTVADTSKIIYNAGSPTYDVTVDSSDGTLHSQQTFSIAVVLDVAPVVTAGHTLNYTENQAATAIDPALTVIDTDNANLVSATVQISGGYVNGEDVLGFTNQNGITGSFNAGTGTLTLTGSSSVANYQTALASVTYVNSSDNPSGAARTVTIITNDGTLDSAPATDTINVTPVNDAPVVTPAGGSTAYIENAAAVVIDGALTVTDPDSSIGSAQVRLSVGFQAGDSLNFVDQNGITGVYTPGTGVLVLSGIASVADYQTALHSITFSSTNNDPGVSKTVEFKVNDQVVDSNLATKTLAITPVNDEPTLTATANGGGHVTFTETSLPDFGGSGPVDLFASPSTSTVEAGQTIAQVVLTVSNVADTTEYLTIGATAVDLVNGNSEAVLVGGAAGTATVSVVAGTATITVTPTTTFSTANVNALVDSLAYSNDDNTPTATTHTISVSSITDSGANGGANGDDNTGAPSVSTIVTVVATNDAPVAVNDTFTGLNGAITNTTLVVDGPTAGTADPSGVQKVITGNILANDADADGGPLTVVAGTITTAQGGTVTLDADGGFVYVPKPNTDGTVDTNDSFTYTVTDGHAAGQNGTATATVTINFVPNSTIWYVDSSYAGANGASDGSSLRPFTDFTQLNGAGGAGDVDAAGDTIFVYDGTYTGNLELEANQKLYGERHGLDAPDGGGGAGTTTLLAADAGAGLTQINGTITASSNNSIQAISWGSSAGVSLTGTNVGALHVNDADAASAGSINNTTGGAVSINGSTAGMNVQFASVSSGAGTAGISLTNALGTFSATGGTLSGHTTSEISISGGTGTISYGGTIGNGSGDSAQINNRTGGTVTLSGNINDTNDTGGGIGISGNANTTINFTGSTKTLNTGIGDGVSMTNNTGTSNVNFTNGGLDIDTSNGTGFQATVAGTYSVTGTGNSITTNGNGAALNLSGIVVGAGGITFDSTSSTNSTGVGVAISGVTGGAIALGTGSISGSDGDAFRVGDGAGTAGTGGTSAITYAGSISKTDGSGQAVDIQDRAAGAGNITLSGNITHNVAANTGILLDDNLAGTITFSGSSKAITSTTATAVNLTDNAGATIAFTNGGLVINTTAGNGFNATGPGAAATTGGTVTVEGSGNTITSTTGTALNVVNTTIGANDVTFQNISATGSSANAGIILDNTGSSGGLHVTGNGTAGSGGTISNKTGANLTLTDSGAPDNSISVTGTNGTGIFLRNTSDVQLDRMQLNDFSNFAIYGNNVTGFQLNHSTISGANGDNNAGGQEESSIRFDNLFTSASYSTASITNSTIGGGGYANLNVRNTSGTLNRLTLDNDTFGLISSTIGNDNVDVTSYNSAVLNVSLTNSNFLGTRSDFFEAIADEQSTMDLVARNNTFHNGQAIIPGGGVAVSLRSDGGGATAHSTVTFDISHNTLTDGGANAFDTVGIFVAKGTGSGTMSGTIASNAIGPAKLNSNSDGIFVRNTGNGSLTTLIQNNTVTGVGNVGIHLQNGDGNATLNASVYGNTVSSPTSAFPFSAFMLDNGTTATDHSIANLVLGSSNGGAGSKNTFNHSALYAADITLNNNFNGNTVLNLSRNGSAAGSILGIVQEDNNGGITAVNTSGGTGVPTPVNTLPALPAVVAPLLAGPGGVEAATPNPGEMHLTQAQLDAVVAVAIAQWAAAGASQSQLAMLHATTFSIANLSGTTLGEEAAPAHITIDVDAAGKGWFVDPTPHDNFEFTHALNAAGTDLLTDPTNAAAGHYDLLTTVSHELGHVLGLPDTTDAATANGLMFIDLAVGERRLPGTADIASAPTTTASVSVGTAGNDTIDAGHGGGVLFGGGGADTFVFSNVDLHTAAPPAPITHVTDYSFAEGDRFDFSALTSQFHATSADDAMIVRAVEDASGQFATLQVNATDPGAPPSTPNWVSVAQIDGVHAGDAVNVMVDSHSAVHLAQIHVGLLV